MNFNTPLFLFFFLPVIVLAFLPAGQKLRLWLLLAASLFFYAWGAPLYFPLIILLAVINYQLGKKLSLQPEKKWPLTAGLVMNIGVLAFFKLTVRYWPQILETAASLGGLAIPEFISLYLQKYFVFPMGLSFLSFQGAAYLLDIRKNPINSARSLKEYLTYLVLFPKLIAGPIVRYRDVGGQLQNMTATAGEMSDGARRFIRGLAKKVLIADQLARLTDGGVFAQAAPNLTTGMAWLVLLTYALQIYYDFSGYSDMAIGLAQMFGLRFPENFNHPYISRSISEFWRRWHITLSGWFRDYVFYPLERKRHGAGGIRQPLNILTVFLLTGLWHGVTLNFIIWGGLHGLAIAFENTPAGKKLSSLPRPLQHAYAMIIILIGWVFFRSPDLHYALVFIQTLAGFPSGNGLAPYSVIPLLEAPFWLAFTAGIALALPVRDIIQSARKRVTARSARLANLLDLAADAGLIGLLWISLVVLAGSSFQPYIYGGF